MIWFLDFLGNLASLVQLTSLKMFHARPSSDPVAKVRLASRKSQQCEQRAHCFSHCISVKKIVSKAHLLHNTSACGINKSHQITSYCAFQETSKAHASGDESTLKHKLFMLPRCPEQTLETATKQVLYLPNSGRSKFLKLLDSKLERRGTKAMTTTRRS